MFDEGPPLRVPLGAVRAETTTERGRIRTWAPAPTVYVTRAEGHVDLALADTFIASGREVIRNDRRLIGFHDWELVRSYDSAARARLTEWGVAVRRDVTAVHFLTSSKLVRMGIAVASIVLPGMLKAHAERAAFEAALREAIETARGG